MRVAALFTVAAGVGTIPAALAWGAAFLFPLLLDVSLARTRWTITPCVIPSVTSVSLEVIII